MEALLLLLKAQPQLLEYFDDHHQYNEICLEAVKQNGYALQYVKKQTPEICMEAVKQNGYALIYVKEQTPEICMEAVKQNGYTLKYVKEQTPEICLAAVKQNGLVINYVNENYKTAEILSAAVKENWQMIHYLSEHEQSHDMYLDVYLDAVKQDGSALRYVKKPTLEIIMAAISQNAVAIRYVEEPTVEMCMEAISQNGEVLQYIKKPTLEICKLAYQKIGMKGIVKYINFNEFNIEDIIGKTEIKYTQITDKIVYKDAITGNCKYIDKCGDICNTILAAFPEDSATIEFITNGKNIDINKKDITTLLMDPTKPIVEGTTLHVIQTGNTYELYKRYTESIDIGYLVSNKVLKYKVEKIGEYLDPQL
jgi:hypothetical protein